VFLDGEDMITVTVNFTTLARVKLKYTEYTLTISAIVHHC